MDTVIENILIADAGGTSTDWLFIRRNESITLEVKRMSCGGINAALMQEEEMVVRMRDISRILPASGEISVYFYGAGCAGEKQCSTVECALRKFSCLENASIVIMSDLAGAGRALLGRDRGIACILGTGSASGLYDGDEIVESVPSLGYILGDEGSGASIGRRILNSVYKGNFPSDVTDAFYRKYHYSVQDILENVYRQPAPNAFMASFSRFAFDHKDNYAVRELIVDEFRLFVKRNLKKYELYGDVSVGFCGSIAYYFQDLLREACSAEKIMVGEIMRSPVEGLLKYHSELL